MKGVSKAGAVVLAVSSVCFAQQPDGASAQLQPEHDPLATRTGLEVGAQVSHYQYTEPGLISLTGNRLGIVGAATVAGSGAFLRFEFRDSYARLNYESNGSGSASGIPDWLLELRGLAGLDVVGDQASISPYVGLGYRYLFNDLRGYSSSAAAGYRRYSNYLYAPIGLTVRFRMGGGWVLAPTAEYDLFIGGKQMTKLSDADPRLMDITNKQSSGSGYRASLMLEKDKWTFGIWTQYWHIQDSEVQFAGVIGGQQVFAKEPENKTRETGAELRYRF